MNIVKSVNHLSLSHKLIWGGVFALTMGYFEAALVQYLRLIFYPDGFTFPLVDIPPRILLIELGREVASIVMLVAVATLLGRTFLNRFAGFAYCFGVWDITYYLFLKLFEGWPTTIFTEDILFLIPAPWVGPVWSPVVIALALIWAAVEVWRRLSRGVTVVINRWEWVAEIIAGLIIILSFLWRAPAAIYKAPLPPFPWYIWLAGMIFGLAIFVNILRRADKIERS